MPKQRRRNRVNEPAQQTRRELRQDGPRLIANVDEADELADTLLDPSRTRPVVVVSIPSGLREPWIDAEEVARDLSGLADVVVIPTDTASWRLSERLPAQTQVYGGAGRAYPPDPEWWRTRAGLHCGSPTGRTTGNGPPTRSSATRSRWCPVPPDLRHR